MVDLCRVLCPRSGRYNSRTSYGQNGLEAAIDQFCRGKSNMYDFSLCVSAMASLFSIKYSPREHWCSFKAINSFSASTSRVSAGVTSANFGLARATSTLHNAEYPPLGPTRLFDIFCTVVGLHWFVHQTKMVRNSGTCHCFTPSVKLVSNEVRPIPHVF